MNAEIEKLIAVFESQLGYTCEDKMNKYAKDIDENYPEWYNGRKYGMGTKDWCTIYFDWCYIQAFGETRAREVLNRPKKSPGAGVRYSREYLKSIGRVGNEPKVGCAVYFGTLPYPRHIGFVYKVTDKMIYTYEGNCYVSSNVTGVKARSYKRDNTDILDYGYPVYSDEQPDPEELNGYKKGNTYETVVNSLMIRDGAGVEYNTVGELKKGEYVVCDRLDEDTDHNTWIEHKDGWSCAMTASGEKYLGEPTKRGWIKVDGKWYFYDAQGQMVKSDWVTYRGDRFYLGADGVMVTGWRMIDKNVYYFFPYGNMACAEYVNGKFLDADGVQRCPVKGAWHKLGSGWWFSTGDGLYIRGRSMRIDGIEYEFDAQGYIVEDIDHV